MTNRVKKFDEDTFEVNSNVRFVDSIEIIDLFVNGTIVGIYFDEFAKSVVYVGEDDVTLTGVKHFRGSLTFNESFLIVEETLNDIHLKEFYEKAIYIDKPIAINSSVLFRDDIVVKKDLEIHETLDVKTIGGVDIDNLKDVVAYLDQPFFFPGNKRNRNHCHRCHSRYYYYKNFLTIVIHF